MEKRRNAYENWIFFTSILALHMAIISHRNIVFAGFQRWVIPITIPIAALILLFVIRLAVKAGERLAATLKGMRIPAWLLFLTTIAAYLWLANRIELG